MLGFPSGYPAESCEAARVRTTFPMPAALIACACARRSEIVQLRGDIVTHITLSKKTNSKPCLEFYSDGSGEARRVTIENFPFRIGRAESADLRVESVEVSREHAEIFERNGMWLVRDLGKHQRHAGQRQADQRDAARRRRHSQGGRNGADLHRLAVVAISADGDAADSIEAIAVAPHMLPPEIAAMRMITEATL